jgi:hypothetical protein
MGKCWSGANRSFRDELRIEGPPKWNLILKLHGQESNDGANGFRCPRDRLPTPDLALVAAFPSISIVKQRDEQSNKNYGMHHVASAIGPKWILSPMRAYALVPVITYPDPGTECYRSTTVWHDVIQIWWWLFLDTVRDVSVIFHSPPPPGAKVSGLSRSWFKMIRMCRPASEQCGEAPRRDTVRIVDVYRSITSRDMCSLAGILVKISTPAGRCRAATNVPGRTKENRTKPT